MTEEEVEKYFNETIPIKAPGMVKGWVRVKIIDYDFSKNTPNGKGIVKVDPLNGRSNVKWALPQIEIYEQPKKSRRKKK